MNAEIRHRLSGLEPDNLLAFMALLGLLRVLEEAEPSWLPRVSWSVDDPPVRPVLHVAQPVSEDSIAAAAAAGLAGTGWPASLRTVQGLEVVAGGRRRKAPRIP